ncbi:MAG: transposase [Candidatus Thermoplasmatota archaeon]|nr:transposase [Candidatus Thermoplasmatota archaeon]
MECIIIADRGFASYEMPKRKGVYLIVAIKRNSDKREIDGKFLYMFEDTYMKTEEKTGIIRKIELGGKKQHDLDAEMPRLGKFSILSNMDADPGEVYELYRAREEVEQAFDTMKNELENDKAYPHTTDGVREYFFISFISLYLYFSILETLREKQLSPKVSVKEALFGLSK